MSTDEMQVKLRSEALGPIDVRTMVRGSDIGASIRVEARDTQVMLASQLSQLEQALNQRNLRVDVALSLANPSRLRTLT